jgi:predicted nucleic acid-binding protein
MRACEHAIRARRGWRRSTVEELAQHVEDEVSVKVKVLGEQCRILIFKVYVAMGYKI